jgi:hypothetical protein
MRITVNGARLYFDVEGAGLAIEEDAPVDRPGRRHAQCRPSAAG